MQASGDAWLLVLRPGVGGRSSGLPHLRGREPGEQEGL